MPLLYLSVETTGLNPMNSEIVTLHLMTASGKSLMIKEPETLEMLKPKLENNVIVGHNLRVALKFLKHKYGISIKNVYDTYIAETVLTGGNNNSLGKLISKYCDTKLKSEESEAITALKYIPEIMQQQQAKIKLSRLENTIDIEMREIPAIVELELSKSRAIKKKKLPFDEAIMQDNSDMEGLDLQGCCRVLMENHTELWKKSYKEAAQDMIFMHPYLEDKYPKSEIEKAFKACYV
ncbi:MAG: hypothetical protein AAGU10_08360 [Methanosarcina mazei]